MTDDELADEAREFLLDEATKKLVDVAKRAAAWLEKNAKKEMTPLRAAFVEQEVKEAAARMVELAGQLRSAAGAQQQRMGRPRKVLPPPEVIREKLKTMSVAKLARQYGVSPRTIYRHLDRPAT